MSEQNANIGPRYAVRLQDLRNWHILTAVCGMCRHRTQMRGIMEQTHLRFVAS